MQPPHVPRHDGEDSGEGAEILFHDIAFWWLSKGNLVGTVRGGNESQWIQAQLLSLRSGLSTSRRSMGMRSGG